MGHGVEKIVEEIPTPAFYVKGDIIYYISQSIDEDTYEYSYELCSVKTKGEDEKTIMKFDSDIYGINMGNDGIYYVGPKENGDIYISFINYEGKGKKEIIQMKDEYSSSLVVTDNWIFYLDYNEDGETVVHRVKTDGKGKQAV